MQAQPIESRSVRTAGLSYVEMIATIAVIAILTGIGITHYLRGHDTVHDINLRANVVLLNRAVDAYINSGGRFNEVTTPVEVIAKLKSVADRQTIPGFRGSFIDQRLRPVMQTIEESAVAGNLRALWNTAESHFFLAEGGAPGVKEFVFDPEFDSGVTEESRYSMMKFASVDGWIWDFDGTATAALTTEATQAQTTDYEPSVENTPFTKTQLAPPEFSHASGTYPFQLFDLTVSLTNPNSAGVSLIYYSLNGGSFTAYSEPIGVPPGGTLAAFCYAFNPDTHFNSFTVAEHYESGPVTLSAGAAVGVFRDANGPDGMVADYSTDGSTATFEWGDGATGYETGSIVSFTGQAFENVLPESYFQLGALDYYNSSIWAGTEADGVWLDIEVDFTLPDILETFTFVLSLENTINRSRQTDDENADFVRISDTDQAFSTLINGIQYQLQLSFGYLGNDGFATVDEFHVHEGKGATANVYGYFLESETEDDSDD